jgi:crotonobetainyl-CoA:carnitine CoA-transferase CaiB-like acyl-CoA transferase
VTEDPQVRSREMIFDIKFPSGEVIKQIGLPIKFSQMEKTMRLPPPALGEHNVDILLSLGYSRGDIDYLTRRGII